MEANEYTRQALALGQGFGLLAEQHRGLREQQKKEKYEQQFQKHLLGFQQDPEGYVPDPNDPDFDPEAFTDAEIKQYTALMNTEEFKRAQFQSWYEESKKNREIALEHIAAAEASFAGVNPDYKTGLKHIERAYESRVNGVDLQFGKDMKSLSYVRPDGTKDGPYTYPSTEAMIMDIREKVSKLETPEAWQVAAMQDKLNKQAYNLGIAKNREWYTNEKGQRGYIMTKELGRQGQITDVRRVVLGVGDVSEKQWEQLGMMPMDIAKKAVEIEAKRAGIETQKVKQKKLRAEAAKQLEEAGYDPKSPEGKLAADLVGMIKRVPVDADTAMRFVLKWEKSKDIANAHRQLLDWGLDPDDDEYKDAMEKFRELTPEVPGEKPKVIGGLKGLPEAKREEIGNEYLRLLGLYGESEARDMIKNKYPDVFIAK